MRVIRPQALAALERRRMIILALSMLAAGVLAGQLTLVSTAEPAAAGLMASASALGLGIGAAWLVRVLRPDRTRDLTSTMTSLVGPAFDDTYTLLVAPRLPIRDVARLDGILVGPAGVRVLTARDWHGRYRASGRTWEFNAGRRGWVRCRTNPGFDIDALVTGFARWAGEHGFRDLPVAGAIVFPQSHSRIVLEEPDHEIVTADNAPWWANRIGRVRRLDPGTAARLVTAVMDEAERVAGRSSQVTPSRSA